MDIRIDHEDNHVHIRLSGELDLYSAHEFKAQMRQLITDMSDRKDRKPVIIDFEKLSYIDSAGLGTFIDMKNLFIRRAIPYALVSIHGNIMKLVQFANLSKFFPIYADKDEALKALRAEFFGRDKNDGAKP